jgi:hypothetical protein
MIAEERETVVRAGDSDDEVFIWSAQARYVSRMRKYPLFREVSTRRVDGTETARFVIDASA